MSLPLPPSPPPPISPPPKRVLFVLGSFRAGGAERQTPAWLRHLDRERFAPALYVISRAGPLAEDCPADVPIFAYEDRAPSSEFYFPGRVFRRQVRDLLQVINEFRPDRLVTVSLLMTLLAGSLPGLGARWFALEIADPRRDFAEQITRFRMIKKRLMRRAYARARPLAVSEGVREGISHFYGIPSERIEVLRNVIDVAHVDAQAAEAGPDLEPECYHIVNVGRFQPQKGHCDLLEAIRLLVQDRHRETIRLHLLGEGPLRREYEDLIARHGLGPYVHLHGFHPNPPAFMARCDLFCLSSVYEGLPLTLLEAMACGTPVVATDCPSGPAEVLVDGAYGLLTPASDPRALATAIEETTTNPAAAQSRAAAAREHILENYSIPSAMERWHRLLS